MKLDILQAIFFFCVCFFFIKIIFPSFRIDKLGFFHFNNDKLRWFGVPKMLKLYNSYDIKNKYFK